MNQEIVDFIRKHRVGCLALLLPDGSVHGATVHYSHTENPLTFYISTSNTSRKCKVLLSGKPARASVVVGFSEEEWITLQMDGEIRMLKKEELQPIYKTHYAKHPNAEKFKNDPDTVFLAFTPTWWRYTNYNTKPETIIES